MKWKHPLNLISGGAFSFLDLEIPSSEAPSPEPSAPPADDDDEEEEPPQRKRGRGR
jgi:hypothetical protein